MLKIHDDGMHNGWVGVEIRVLGPIEVVADGKPVRLGGPKQRAVLAMLVVDLGRSVHADRFIDEIWDGEATAARSLQVYVSELRSLLGGRDSIRGDAGGYRLTLGREAIDAARFADVVEAGRRMAAAGDPERAAETLRRALTLWRGRAFADVADEAFVQAEGARLEELRLVATEMWADAALAIGHHAGLIPDLEALVAKEPLRETPRRQLMLALYRTGRQADALAAYHDARRVLRDELGIEPGPGLKQLEIDILRQDPTLDVEPVEISRRRRLPAPATELVGRRREVEAIRARLSADARLVTVTGPGGTGKTRVALQAAHELASEFEGGVVFVGLAALRDPDLVPARIATSLGVVDARDPLEALADHFGTRDVLLLLDNFEQVDEAAPALSRLLASAPGVRLLVTSRHRLRLYGEHEFEVGPLDLETEAVPLFISRAAASGRRLAAEPVVRAICERLDRLPLAIELAAARVRELAPAQMLESLSRLALAIEGPRDLPDRQRTLEQAIGWSHDLLDRIQQERFASVAVFAGGFTADAASEVSGATGSDLDELVRRSLIDRAGARFEMLETIREFALTRLDEHRPGEVRRRHARWCLAVAQEADAVLREGGDTAPWLDRLELEHDNMRAALDWATDAEPELGLALAMALGSFWEWRGHIEEGRQRLDTALAAASAADPGLRARALVRSGVFANMRGDLDAAIERLEDAADIARAAGDPVIVARSLRNIATVEKDRGAHDRALGLHEEARVISAAIGDHLGVSASLIGLADVSLARGADDAARGYALQGLEAARRLGHDMRTISALLNLGLAELRLGHDGDAVTAYDEVLDLCDRNRYSEGAAYAFLGLAALAAERGEPRLSALLLGATDEQLGIAGAVLESTERPLRERTLERLTIELGSKELDEGLLDGRALAMPEAMALARRVAATLRAD
jgi:predicted ATPase/DNA-binding SARP family transcriptional activator